MSAKQILRARQRMSPGGGRSDGFWDREQVERYDYAVAEMSLPKRERLRRQSALGSCAQSVEMMIMMIMGRGCRYHVRDAII